MLPARLNLIDRYIFREAFVSTIVVVAVLLLIFMSSQFAGTLGDAAAGLLPRETVFRVFWLQFLQYLAFLAPFGLMLGILLALARLNRDSEMAALSACGIGPGRLLVPIGTLAVLFTAVISWLSFVESPNATREIELIRYEAKEQLVDGAFAPGRVASVDGGSTDVRVGGAVGTQLTDIFIHRQTDDRIEVVVAKEGQKIEDETGGVALQLRDGTRYEGIPGDNQFRIVEFEIHGFPIELESEEFEPSLEALSTVELWQRADGEAMAEMQWRAAIPLSMLALTLLTIPLGKSSPREGKYARVGAGLLIYIIYANTLSIAKVWVERGDVPGWLGTWWVHLAVIVFAIAMLARQSGPAAGSDPIRKERREPTC